MCVIKYHLKFGQDLKNFYSASLLETGIPYVWTIETWWVLCVVVCINNPRHLCQSVHLCMCVLFYPLTLR